MAIALVSDDAFSAGSGINPFTVTVAAPPINGNLQIVSTNIATAGDAVTNVAETNAVATQLLVNTTNTKSSTWRLMPGGSPGSVVTITKAGVIAANHQVSVVQFSGLPTTTAGYNATASGVATGTGTVVATQTVTPTAGAEVLLVAMLRGNGTAGAFTAGWTALNVPGTGITVLAYRIIASASGSYFCDSTFSGSSNWSAHIVAFENAPPLAVALKASLLIAG